MSRRGRVGEQTIEMTKTVALDTCRSSQIEICYEMSELPVGEEIQFAVELNFASMAAGQPDRYFYDSEGQQLGPLETIQQLPTGNRIGLVDEWLGIDVGIELSEAAEFWTFPIQTVSQSEGGFELVHQSSVVVPWWRFMVDDSQKWSCTFSVNIDTSAASARQLTSIAMR